MNQPAASSTTPATPDTRPCFMCTRATPASCPGMKDGNWSAGMTKYTTATTISTRPITVRRSFMGTSLRLAESGVRRTLAIGNASRPRAARGIHVNLGVDILCVRPRESGDPVANSPARERLVLRLGALRGRTCGDARDVGGELRPLWQQLELRAEADVGADHHVGGGELLAHQPRPFLHRLGDDVHRRIERAVAEHGAPRLLLAWSRAVDHRRFEAARPEEQPFEIDAAARRAGRHVELRA